VARRPWQLRISSPSVKEAGPCALGERLLLTGPEIPQVSALLAEETVQVGAMLTADFGRSILPVLLAPPTPGESHTLERPGGAYLAGPFPRKEPARGHVGASHLREWH